MLQITKPEVSLRQALIERSDALRERRQGIRENSRIRWDADWNEYYFLLGAQWTYDQAAAECGFTSSLTLAERAEVGTGWFRDHLPERDLVAAERGRQFALSIIRGLELK